MIKLNIPPLLEQIRDNMLDKNNNAHVRYNYSLTMANIKDFCDRALDEYNNQDRQQTKKGRQLNSLQTKGN